MPNDVLMPFGKHKGQPIKGLSQRYCEWLLINVQLYGEVEAAVRQRLGLPISEPKESIEDRIDRIVQTTAERLRQMATTEEAD